MYSVTPQVGALWRRLLETVLQVRGVAVEIVDHAPPAPISELWRRPDKAAVFMCGLPLSLGRAAAASVAAPVPSPAAYGGRACSGPTWWCVPTAPFATLEQTFGHRLCARPRRESQSGFAAPLHALMRYGARPLYREIVAPPSLRSAR